MQETIKLCVMVGLVVGLFMGAGVWLTDDRRVSNSIIPYSVLGAVGGCVGAALGLALGDLQSAPEGKIFAIALLTSLIVALAVAFGFKAAMRTSQEK
jgi:small basic protein